MSTAAPPTGFLRVVVGYDGSPPASRALDATVRLQGRAGHIDVVYVVVGSSPHATHRVAGSVAVDLARHSPVPLSIVP